jgi:hypothetical protein
MNEMTGNCHFLVAFSTPWSSGARSIPQFSQLARAFPMEEKMTNKTRVKLFSRLILSSALASGLLATPAWAEPKPGKVSGAIFVGGDLPVSGKVHGGATSNIPNLGALNPALAGVSATLNIDPKSHKTVYGNALSYGGELSYGVSENGELLGAVRYTSAKGGQLTVGNAVAGAPVNATLPVLGQFSKYKAWTGTIGYRHYLGAPGSVRPYGAVHLGATRTGKINATFDIPAAAINIPNAPFYKRSWSFTPGADVGLSLPVGESFSLQAEAGVRYTAGLRDDDSAIAGLGLATINDTGKRLSVPITVRAKFSF